MIIKPHSFKRLNKQPLKLALIISGLFCITHAQAAGKLDLELGYESTVFFEEGQRPDDRPLKQQTNNSFTAELEYYHSWADDSQSFTFTPFYRYDETDDERTHGDIREMIWHQVADSYELKVGIGKVFWGVTESAHLVDIVNQTDSVEAIDGEDKLGQPMVQLLLEEDWGNLDVFILPYHSERTFAGPNARLSGGFEMADAVYEADDEESNVDVALRWSHYWDELEYSLSYFHGTSREPTLGIKVNSDRSLEGLPYYPLIEQYGIELQYLYEDWTWKLEGIYRKGMPEQNVNVNGQNVGIYEQEAIPFFSIPASTTIGDEKDYYATVAGFEYTQVGIFESRVDLGWVVEHLYDSRDEKAAITASEHDVLLATRWVANDADDSELLAGIFYDYEYEDYSLSLEGNTRILDNISVELEGRFFMIEDEENSQYGFRNEDFVKLSLTYFY